MEQQQLATMLSIEKHVYPVKAVRSHPRRRLIADSLNKVCSPYPVQPIRPPWPFLLAARRRETVR